jgi:chemotaxis family two-component system sensor kinase Cph1
MNSYKVDLTNCDKEPIHIPGKIQSHGFLVAVNKKSNLITYISENIQPFIKSAAKDHLGQHIDSLEEQFDITGTQLKLSQVIKLGSSNEQFTAVNPFAIILNKKPYNLIITVSGDEKVLEFETVDSDLDFDVQKSIGRAVSEILSGKNLNALLSNAAQKIKDIILYDRIMIYRFGEDGHGEVVAEVKNDDLEPFLGLHYPATDIPKQARELYKINLTRIIADVNADSSPIVTYQLDAAPLDLTHSELRAVSPIHIQYLKNMGVASSFSISLIAHGELWGLVACHNYSARFINYKARDASKLIGQILSSALEYRQDEENNEKSARLTLAADELSKHIEKENYLTDALLRHDVTFKDITSATGAVLIFDNETHTVGVTPAPEEIKEIVKWLKANMQESVYYTHRFPEIYYPAKHYSGVASGILACILSKELSEMIIWFKPEQIETINWAGNPEKPVENMENGIMQLSPRKSFESWTQIVKNTSERWSSEEISAVIRIREQVIYAISRKANDIRVLNERLNLAYGDTPVIQGDPIMMTQVFTNLINNAVKYSSRSYPSKVKVEGVVNNDEVIYSIEDNGVGIDVNYYSRVFELFKRMDNVKEFDGTGVGLAIVKRILDKHEARIWFESTLGFGTIFYISFKNLQK